MSIGTIGRNLKLLFVHDGPVMADEAGNLYPQTPPTDVLHRYSAIAEEVVLCERMKRDSVENASTRPSNRDTVSLAACPNVCAFPEAVTKRGFARSIIKKQVRECDLLVVRVPSFLADMAVVEARRQRKPYLAEVAGCAWDSLWNHSLKGKIVAPFATLAMRRSVRNADYAVYVTKEFLQKRYPCNGKCLGNSDAVLPRMDAAVWEARLQHIAQCDANKLIMGTTGFVDVKYKSQADAIRALGKLKARGITNIEYQLVGEGDQTYLSNVARACGVEEQVRFLGVMLHENVFDWLDTIDLYIQPSKQEGLPRGTLEAMSRGLLCIGSDVGGLPELLDAEYIFNHRRREAEQIANILRRVSKDALIEQGRRNFHKAQEYDTATLEKERDAFMRTFAEVACSK